MLSGMTRLATGLVLLLASGCGGESQGVAAATGGPRAQAGAGGERLAEPARPIPGLEALYHECDEERGRLQAVVDSGSADGDWVFDANLTEERVLTAAMLLTLISLGHAPHGHPEVAEPPASRLPTPSAAVRQRARARMREIDVAIDDVTDFRAGHPGRESWSDSDRAAWAALQDHLTARCIHR